MPRTYYAPFGLQKTTYAAPAGSGAGPYPLGTKLVLPDERTFRHALAGASARVAGRLYQSVVPLTAGQHTELVVSTVPAIGDKTIAATTVTTAGAIDIYSEGFAWFNKSTGLDYGHRIRRAIASGQAHAAFAAGGIVTVNLEPGETVDVAGGASTEVSLTRNRWHSTIICPSPATAAVSGVSIGVAAGSRYYYEQTRGECAVGIEGTMVISDPIVASATSDGLAMPSAAIETDGPQIGIALNLNITAETGCVFLTMD